jgi:hypothetical protein
MDSPKKSMRALTVVKPHAALQTNHQHELDTHWRITRRITRRIAETLTHLMPAMMTFPAPHPKALDTLMTDRAGPRAHPAPLTPPERHVVSPDILKVARRLAASLTMRDMRHADVLGVRL